MKKLTAILLLAILSFNWIGYRFLVEYLQHRSDQQLEARIDKNQYDEGQLTEVKVPVHMPYQNSTAEYERYDGEITLNGTLYKYVERRVSNDTLYLRCLPNVQKMHLENAKEDYFKSINDLAQNHNSQKQESSKTGVFKKIVSDFDEPFLTQVGSSGKHHLRIFGLFAEDDLLSAPTVSPEQPPDSLTV